MSCLVNTVKRPLNQIFRIAWQLFFALRVRLLLSHTCTLQPKWALLSTTEDALAFSDRVGFPVLVRPSFVLSGAAMAVASNNTELEVIIHNLRVGRSGEVMRHRWAREVPPCVLLDQP